MKYIKCEAIVKDGLKEVARIEGRPMDASLITVEDGQKLIDIEHLFERTFGYRLHVSVTPIE